VGVIEVGLLGRWDATNVVESDVAVLTNISLDHTEFAGPTHAHIAREKVGIVKSNSVFVQGETRPDVQEILAAAPCAKRVVRDEHFEVLENELAVGGRLVSVRTTRAEHRELFVPLHGRHQGDNAATAIVAVEEFFDHAISRDVLDEGMATVSMPGRFEVMGHQPLVIVDGAHNVGGAEVCADVASTSSRRTLVLLKPDAVERRLVGDIVSRFERKGLSIAAMQLRTLDKSILAKHYEEHQGKGFYADLVAFMSRGPVVAMVVEGPDDTWEIVRAMMGATNPRAAAPGTIRGDLGTIFTENLIHGSDSAASAEREIQIFFPGL
ncbi:MAG: nucleoside-diphosphate kinase, partial [Actinobacteria bacterium]|nr:nucleoside-diphosphate kinase [Actinomycetota bacterium]